VLSPDLIQRISVLLDVDISSNQDDLAELQVISDRFQVWINQVKERARLAAERPASILDTHTQPDEYGVERIEASDKV